MRARTLASIAFLGGVVAAQGCGGDFDPGSRITSLRVLAVQADLPYAKPGETVNLTAEWYAPQADKKVDPYSASTDARHRNWYWLRCIDPDDTSVVGCIKAVGDEVKQTGDVTKAFLNVPDGTDQDTAKVTIPDDALTRLPEDARKNATVGIVLLVCPGTINLANGDLSSISTGQVPLECDDETPDANGKHPALPLEQWVAGIKRIYVRDTDRNANPTISRITWDGNTWSASDPPPSIKPCDDDGNRYDRCDTDQHQIAVELSNDSIESGTDEFGSPFHEQVVVEFYSTEGTFEHEVKIASSANTGFAARKQSKDGLRPIKIWIVVHDDRGGVTWEERVVQPVPD
jgi:hypothetical protein